MVWQLDVNSIKPYKDRLLVRPVRHPEIDQTESGLWFFEQDLFPPYGEVLRVGTGVREDIHVGDVVLFGQFSMDNIPLALYDNFKEEVYIIKEEKIVAVYRFED